MCLFKKASGVKVDPQCIEAYNRFKMGKGIAYLILGFNDDLSKIIVLHEEKKKFTGDSIKEKSNRQ